MTQCVSVCLALLSWLPDWTRVFTVTVCVYAQQFLLARLAQPRLTELAAEASLASRLPPHCVFLRNVKLWKLSVGLGLRVGSN